MNRTKKITSEYSVELRNSLGTTLSAFKPTGVDKSTIVKLVNRFYNASSGKITIDETSKTTTKGVWSDCHYAKECALFNDTIRHNVPYQISNIVDPSLTNKSSKREELPAWKIAFSSKRTNRSIGQGGRLRLSGGQKQSLAISKTIQRKQKIMIYEATAVWTPRRKLRFRAF